MAPRTIHDLPTPALLLDADALDRNVRRMAEHVRGLGARLRPHAKTHKCVEVARLQQRHGAAGLTVATAVEARDFAAAGFDDLTWAVPVPLSRLNEVMDLARRITFRVIVDSTAAVAALADAARAAGLVAHAWLEVDCGDHRSGVDPGGDLALELARRLSGDPNLAFDGILTHAGHSYGARDREARLAVAEQERSVMDACAERLRREGVAVPDVSVGSTPSISVAESLAGVTEARPGNYVFHDWMQAAAGVCAPADVAVSVLATVVSRQPNLPHAIVDAGALAMSKDLGPGLSERRRGLGPLYRGLSGAELEPDLTLSRVSQEHGFVEGGPDALARLRVGDRVRIMPNHSCLTAALFDHYWVVQGEAVVDRWTILRGR